MIMKPLASLDYHRNMSAPNLILIGNDDFCTNSVSNSWWFSVFVDISVRSRPKEQGNNSSCQLAGIPFFTHKYAVLCQGVRVVT